jgi:hypothetical protein
VDGAAESGGALGEAGEPVARAELADADGASWRRMVDDLEADAVAAGHAYLDGRARGMPDRVGQAFLQDLDFTLAAVYGDPARSDGAAARVAAWPLRSEHLLRRAVCAPGQPACQQVSRGGGLSGE